MKTMEKGVDFSVLVRGAAPERVFDTFATAEGLNQRPGRLAFQWRADSGGYSTTAVVTFEAHEGGTWVLLTENGSEDSPVGLQDLLNRAQGWGCVLTLLKCFVEHGLTY
jgi:uncharacterized protein YndB with AHSA1/START domain